MTDASWPLQKAVFARLSGDAALMTLVTAIYDQVPEEPSFPYVTIGEDTAMDWGTKSTQGQEVTLTIHAWSRARGRREVKQIMAEIYRLLHEATLIVSGFFQCVVAVRIQQNVSVIRMG